MESSEQSTAGADTTTPGAEAADASESKTGLQRLSELLDDDGNASGEDDATSSGSEDKTELKKFNDLAGKLGVDLDELYKLEVNSSDDGEPVTIEQLKDLHKSKSDFDLSVIEFEERRTQQEQDMMRAQSELQEILQALPKNAVKPEVLNKIREKSEKTATLERQRTLQVIPEWNDSKIREADITGMTEHLQAYGFPTNYLSQVVSHRQLKYIRDNWQREQRIRKALEQVRAGKPDKSASSKPQKKPPQKNPISNVKRGSAPNKLQAVFSNLE